MSGARRTGPAAVVKFIRERMRSGVTLQAIVNRLERPGLPAPDGGTLWMPRDVKKFILSGLREARVRLKRAA